MRRLQKAVPVPDSLRWPRRLGVAALMLAVFAGVPGGTADAAFRVKPLKISLKNAAETGAITVVNEGKAPMSIQVSAAAWTQDAEGKDVYSPTADVAFFPKLAVLDPGGTQVVRVGLKAAAADLEKSYRLYVEELPRPVHGAAPTIVILARFGVAVYAAPREERVGGELAGVGVSGGVFHVLVRNTGNVQFRIKGLRVRGLDRAGAEVFAKELTGWYLLGGVSRRHEVQIPAEECSRLAKVLVVAETDAMELAGEAAVEAGNCAR